MVLTITEACLVDLHTECPDTREDKYQCDCSCHIEQTHEAIREKIEPQDGQGYYGGFSSSPPRPESVRRGGGDPLADYLHAKGEI